MTEYLFAIWFAEYFKATLGTYCSEERFLLKYYYSLTMHLVTQELWWRCTIRLIHFNAPSTTSICSPMDQGVISTFMSYFFFRNRNAFCKALAVIDSNSSDGSWQSKLKTWKGFTILDAIKNINDSWKEIRSLFQRSQMTLRGLILKWNK